MGGGKPKTKTKTRRIVDQMEFYFSDSNLRRRDRFLREKILQCVPLDVLGEGECRQTGMGLDLGIFLTFNNIMAITTSVDELRDALAESSQLLHVFEVPVPQDGGGDGGSKWYVGRKDWIGRTELQTFLAQLDGNSCEFDQRTIYCENLPSCATQEWVRKLFHRFGSINLVSVPKFRGSQRIKQFCFVEFASPDTVTLVLDFFRPFNGVLSYDDGEAENLLSINTFHEENQEMQETDQTQTKESKKKPKRRKKKKDEDKSGDEEEAAAPVPDPDVVDKNERPELNENMIYDLKIMPKMEWKRLRNKYLNLQREMVREMKKQAFFKRMANQPKPSCPQIESQLKRDPEQDQSEPRRRRKRGREKVQEAIKKSSHIFFDADGE